MCSKDGPPAGLATMEPGTILAAMLSAVDGDGLCGYQRVVVLEAYQRMASYFQAHVLREMASIAELMEQTELDPEIASESAAAEIRAALRLTRRAADADLALALGLKQRLPRVWEALAAGSIDLRRARVIVDGTAHLTEEAARKVVDMIIERAARSTTGQLNALVRRVCIEADPEDSEKRYVEATNDRRVTVEPSMDGTAHLFVFDLAPDRVTVAMRRITDLAKSLKTEFETRSLDQLRADVFLDLLEGTAFHSQGRPGTVDVRVDLETLARLKEDPGELAGYGPVIADIARQVAETNQRAEWRWTLTHPETGQIIDNGTTRRRPNPGQRRHVEARQTICIFPGCRMPATSCDLDHRATWAENGPTTVDNLAPLCRHDHRVRHRSGWSYEPLPGGDHRWISRLGHVYTTSGLPP